MKVNKQRLIFQSKVEFAEGKPPKEIQILPVGKWDHPRYGVIAITTDDIKEFKDNFDKKIRKDIPITQGHESFDEKPAIGWFIKVEDRGDQGLWGRVDWNESGKTALKQKAFKYFSPEFHQFYEDPETREEHKNVLVGGALTNKPYFKELKAVVFSDKDLINSSDKDTMLVLKDLVKKEVADLTDDEKTFINEHKDELSEEETTKFESVIETDGGDDNDDKEETEEEKATREEKEEGDKNEEDGLNRDGTKKEASEMVQMSASEKLALEEKANKGATAFAELDKMRVEKSLATLLFNENNAKGKVLPKNKDMVFTFMTELSEKQRATFSEIINAIPSTKMFKEIGAQNASENSAEVEVDTKVKTLMKENKEMTYSEAVNKIFAENKELGKRYNKELA